MAEELIYGQIREEMQLEPGWEAACNEEKDLQEVWAIFHSFGRERGEYILKAATALFEKEISEWVFGYDEMPSALWAGCLYTATVWETG